MNPKINDGECGQNGVKENRPPVPIPASVFIESSQAQPHGKWNSNVKGRHAVGERVDASEPVRDFWRQGVGQGFHLRYHVPGNADVEKQVKWQGKDVHPSDGQCHSVSKPAVVKISEVKHRNIADEHKPCNVKMGENGSEPIGLEGLLDPQHKVAFHRPDVRRHVQTSAGHQHTIDLVNAVFGVVNGEHDENVNPIPPEKINKRGQ